MGPESLRDLAIRLGQHQCAQMGVHGDSLHPAWSSGVPPVHGGPSGLSTLLAFTIAAVECRRTQSSHGTYRKRIKGWIFTGQGTKKYVFFFFWFFFNKFFCC